LDTDVFGKSLLERAGLQKAGTTREKEDRSLLDDYRQLMDDASAEKHTGPPEQP
jgi:hypothetical protein